MAVASAPQGVMREGQDDQLVRAEAHAGLVGLCESLSKPDALADVLLAFLELRLRRHGPEGVDIEGGWELGVSPGWPVDELWHHMLLNTKVCIARCSVPTTAAKCF